MSRRYTSPEKDDILQQLDENFGNVTLTALQTGVPLRTLYAWKRGRKLERLKAGEPLRQRKNALLPLQTAANPDSEETPENEYALIRERLMEHVFNLIETLTDDPDTAHLRISALSRLLDRVIKLETLARPESDTQIVRWEFVDPDGSVHDTPPWHRGPSGDG